MKYIKTLLPEILQGKGKLKNFQGTFIEELIKIKDNFKDIDFIQENQQYKLVGKPDSVKAFSQVISDRGASIFLLCYRNYLKNKDNFVFQSEPEQNFDELAFIYNSGYIRFNPEKDSDGDRTSNLFFYIDSGIVNISIVFDNGQIGFFREALNNLDKEISITPFHKKLLFYVFTVQMKEGKVKKDIVPKKYRKKFSSAIYQLYC